jgi:hypothetical protein
VDLAAGGSMVAKGLGPGSARKVADALGIGA